jgi:hypothetical protein
MIFAGKEHTQRRATGYEVCMNLSYGYVGSFVSPPDCNVTVANPSDIEEA